MERNKESDKDNNERMANGKSQTNTITSVKQIANDNNNRKNDAKVVNVKQNGVKPSTVEGIHSSLLNFNKISSLPSPKHAHAYVDEEEHMAYATPNTPSTPITNTDELITQSANIIKEAFERYAPETIGISFNGGKDSVVMVELILITMGESVLNKCFLFVLDESNEFPELVAFRKAYVAAKLPHATLRHFAATDSMSDGLWEVKRTSNIAAAFVGTRRSDPSGKYQKTPFEPTTSGWPPMMRICPLLYWEYCDVWSYIRANHVPFCKLYLEGYSSIGRQSSTFKQRHLQRDDGTFNPPWFLPDNQL